MHDETTSCTTPASAGAPADIDQAIRAALSAAIKSSRKSRQRIANEMSQLAGRKISVFMLNCYTAEGKAGHRFPVQMALAFELATGTHCITQLLAEAGGCKLLVGEDIALAELAQIERDKLALERREQKIKTALAAARRADPEQ